MPFDEGDAPRVPFDEGDAPRDLPALEMMAGELLPSPPVGEGGSARSAETDEGCWKKRQRRDPSSTPHPTELRSATFSHKGRRKRSYSFAKSSGVGQPSTGKPNRICSLRIASRVLVPRMPSTVPTS